EDVMDLLVDPLTGAAAAAELGGLHPSLRWLDAEGEHRHQGVTQAFPNREAVVLGHSETGTRVVVSVGGPSNPAVYYLVNFTTHRADMGGGSFPRVAPLPVGGGAAA